MKGKTIIALLAGCAIVMYSSCYKTGEPIYQPTCKPDSIQVNNPLYNYSYLLGIETFEGSLTYDVNRNLIDAKRIVNGGTDPFEFTFYYDNNNNLLEINIFDSHGGVRGDFIKYITFSYPSGTAASLSSTAKVQVFELQGDGAWLQYPIWTYNFNAQYQLESVFLGSVPLQRLTYDYGGNCLADSVYDEQGQLTDYYIYSSYDNGINPARSDRSLQLFFQMYSKNNPTNSVRYRQVFFGNIGVFTAYKSSIGNYTYNIFNYPTSSNGLDFFAFYNCALTPPPSSQVPPPPVKLPPGSVLPGQ